MALCLALSEVGCTFYTACPAGNNDTPANTAGSNNAGGGGSSTAGSGSSTSGASSGGEGGDGGMTGPILDDEPPPGDWASAAPDLGDLKDSCGPYFGLVVRPDRDELIAGAYYGLWSTRDGGATWSQLGTGGDGMHSTNNRMSQITFDPDDPDGFWEVGVYGPGFFRTDDGGDTFEQIGDKTHLDSVGIDLTDPARKTMLASAHEQPILFKSVDGGETWTDIYASTPENTKHCSYSLVQDADTYLMACGGGSDPGDAKIIRTTDGGDSWEQVHDGGGNTLPLLHSDGSIYWSEENGALARSEDGGETWERVVPGGVLVQIQPAELPDGRIASLTPQAVVVSDDGGKTWKKASAELPFMNATGFVYSGFQKAFFISRFSCGAVMGAKGDELMRFDFDYEKY